jgi:hypothetical protein
MMAINAPSEKKSVRTGDGAEPRNQHVPSVTVPALEWKFIPNEIKDPIPPPKLKITWLKIWINFRADFDVYEEAGFLPRRYQLLGLSDRVMDTIP